MDIVPCRDFAELIGHAGAAGDPGDEPLRTLQHALEHLLRAAHFPQYVDVDRTLAAGDVVRAPDLVDRAVDRITDQLVVPLAAGQRAIDLRDDLAFGVIAVGVNRRDRPDTARRRPGAARHMVGRRHALATLDQRPDFTSAVKDRLQTFEHY